MKPEEDARYFLVGVREVHVSTILIEAYNKEEAKRLVGEGEEIYLEYSHTLDQNLWSVEEVNPCK